MIDSFINTSAVRAVVRRVQSQVDPGTVLTCGSQWLMEYSNDANPKCYLICTFYFVPEQTHWNLTANVVMTMYKICIHEIGVFGKSRWALRFSVKHVRAHERHV